MKAREVMSFRESLAVLRAMLEVCGVLVGFVERVGAVDQCCLLSIVSCRSSSCPAVEWMV